MTLTGEPPAAIDDLVLRLGRTPWRCRTNRTAAGCRSHERRPRPGGAGRCRVVVVNLSRLPEPPGRDHDVPSRSAEATAAGFARWGRPTAALAPGTAIAVLGQTGTAIALAPGTAIAVLGETDPAVAPR